MRLRLTSRLVGHRTGGAVQQGRADHRQCHIVGHLVGHLIHIEVFGVDLLHVGNHLVGNAEERGIDHIVLPQLHLTHPALVEQGELLQELFQTKHLAHLVEPLLIGGNARLGVEGADERVGDALVLAAMHEGLEFLGLEDGVAAGSQLEDVVHLAQQHGLVGGVGQVVDDEVLLRLALGIEARLDADGTHVDEFQDAGGEEVVIVGSEIFVGIEHVVGCLKVAFQGDVAVPEQILVDLLPGAPDIDEVPDATDDGHDEEAEDGEEEADDAHGIHHGIAAAAVVVVVVAALEGLVLLRLEGLGLLEGGLEETLVEAHHDIHGAAATEGLGVPRLDGAVLGEGDLTTETEAPDAAVVLVEGDGLQLANAVGELLGRYNREAGLVGLGEDALVDEHVADGVVVAVGVDDVGVGIGGDVGTLTAVAEAPAEFAATILIDDAALAGLPRAGAVDIPRSDILEHGAGLVGNGQVAHLTAGGGAQAHVALRAFGVDGHLARLGDAGIAVTAQHDPDVKAVQFRAGKKACCRRQQRQQQDHFTS